MRSDRNTRYRWATSALFVVMLLLVVAALARLSVRYGETFDWTQSRGNTLSAPSTALLGRMTGPVEITAYVSQSNRLRPAIQSLIERYRRFKPNLGLRFVDPDDAPQEVRELGIARDGEMRVSYAGRSRVISETSESALSNALNRLVRSEHRWIAYLTGHGERDLLGRANHDLGSFGAHLQSTGIRVQPLSLTDTEEVPANTALLVLTSPQVALLDGEPQKLQRYLAGGGNLLWLTEPGAKVDQGWLAQTLGIEVLPGIVIDPAPMHGIDRATVTVITRYPDHPTTQAFDIATVLVETAALQPSSTSQWKSAPVLQTHERLWAESTPTSETAHYQPDEDLAGPLLVGIALERDAPDPTSSATQRVVVVGDGDFLSNAYLANGGNLALGTSLVNWLIHDDALVSIPIKSRPDRVLTLSAQQGVVIGVGVLFGAPAALALTGVALWWRRRRK